MKIKIGILSFSDGRERVHQTLEAYILESQEGIVKALANESNIEIVQVSQVIHSNKEAKEQALALKSENVHGVIFHVPVFAFPNFAVISRTVLKEIPCIAISPADPAYPGLGGLQASVNAIRQTGMQCEKIWGNIEDNDVKNRLIAFLRSAHGVSGLKGSVYGLFGGRSIGMGSGAVNQDLWMQYFGVDSDHVDQLEIIRRAAVIPEEKVEYAYQWLLKKTKRVDFDDNKLTENSLKEQIRCYYATKEIVAEKGYDFIGVKCHYELSEYHCTQCLSAAFFNDPYDWDGKKETTVLSCEADSDGALTMQILKLISGKPVLFSDFRYYDEQDKVFVFCNCGAMSTWYAQRSDVPEENLKEVSLMPIIEKYGGKGCHVKYVGKESECITLCRLTRVLDQYTLTVFLGKISYMPESKTNDTCSAWPHIFVEVGMNPMDLIQQYDNNHVHGVDGDYVRELELFCKLTGVEFKLIQ